MSNLKSRFGLLVALSVAGYGLSFCSQLIISYYFGTSTTLDAYWAALAIANFMCFYLNPFKESLVPAIHTASEKSIEAAGKTLSAGLSFLFILVTISTFFLWLFPHGLAQWIGSDTKTTSGLSEILTWFLPFIFLFALSEILNSILVSFNKVLYQAIVRLVAAIFSLIFIALTGENLGVESMVLALLASQVVVIIMSCHALRKYPIKVRFDAMAVLKKEQVFTLFGALLFSYLVAQLYVLFERSVMISLAPGLLSSFQYSSSLVNVLIGVIAVPLSNLIWHKFLQARVSGDYAIAGSVVLRAAAFLFIVLMLICTFAFMHAKQIVYFVYSRGAFNDASLALTTQTFKSTIFAAIPIGLSTILGRFLISVGSARENASIGISIAFMGMLVILCSWYLESPSVVQLHWLLGNLVGLVISIWFFVRKCNIITSDLVVTIKWILVASFSIIFCSIVQPNLSFGSSKLLVFFELASNFLIFLFMTILMATLTGLLKKIKFILRPVG